MCLINQDIYLGLSKMGRSLYGTLCCLANGHTGTLVIDLAGLCEAADMSVNSVIKYTAEIEDTGAVRVTRIKGGKRNKVNRYEIRTQEMQLEEERGADSDQDMQLERDIQALLNQDLQLEGLFRLQEMESGDRLPLQMVESGDGSPLQMVESDGGSPLHEVKGESVSSSFLLDSIPERLTESLSANAEGLVETVEAVSADGADEDPDGLDMMRLLRAAGVYANLAARAVAEYPHERIRAVCEYAIRHDLVRGWAYTTLKSGEPVPVEDAVAAPAVFPDETEIVVTEEKVVPVEKTPEPAAWEQARHQLALQFDKFTYQAYLKHLRVVDVDGSDWRFVCEREEVADMCQYRLYRDIQRVLSMTSGGDVTMTFGVAGEAGVGC